MIVILYMIGSFLWGMHRYGNEIDVSVLKPFNMQDIQDIVQLYAQEKKLAVPLAQQQLANTESVSNVETVSSKVDSIASFEKNISFNHIAVFHGKASITSGVTFKLFRPVAESWRKYDARSIHLYGVDTCAPRQKAKFNHQEWPCGVVAMAWLVTKTLGQNLSCKKVFIRKNVYYAQCFVQGVDLAEAGLAEGILLLSKDNKNPIPEQYRRAEEVARSKKLGLWTSDFTEPWRWKRDNGSYNPFAHE